jgi:dTDP-glucose 4,6-dehydratase
VDDLVEGVVRLLDSGEPGPINIGNTHEMPILALAELIRELAGADSEICFAERPVDDPAVRCPDIGLARTLLGWEPQVSIAAGLERTIRWFGEQLEPPIGTLPMTPWASPSRVGGTGPGDR